MSYNFAHEKVFNAEKISYMRKILSFYYANKYEISKKMIKKL